MSWGIRSRQLVARLTLAAFLSTTAGPLFAAPQQAGGGGASTGSGSQSAKRTGKRPKLDEQLNRVLDGGATAPQRVIVRTKQGARGSAKDKVRSRGQSVREDFESLEAFSAELDGATLE